MKIDGISYNNEAGLYNAHLASGKKICINDVIQENLELAVTNHQLTIKLGEAKITQAANNRMLEIISGHANARGNKIHSMIRELSDHRESLRCHVLVEADLRRRLDTTREALRDASKKADARQAAIEGLVKAIDRPGVADDVKAMGLKVLNNLVKALA